MKPVNAYLRQEMRSYLAAVPDATEQELAALNAWVRQGNSPYCNPSHIADEQVSIPLKKTTETGQIDHLLR
jgi:hypothetical protein